MERKGPQPIPPLPLLADRQGSRRGFMSRWTAALVGLILINPAFQPIAGAIDWRTLPSYFTHDPHSGVRVEQFAKVEAPPIVDQSRRISSGYTHYRSTIQFGQSADNYHRVDQWGEPVRPYGEWRFPFRPFSAPYEQWGPPFAGLNLGFGFGGFGFPSFPHHGHGNAGPNDPWQSDPGTGHPGRWPRFPGVGNPGFPFQPYPADPNGPYPVPPWYDGFYPDYPVRPRLNDRQFFRSPLSP